MSSTSSSSTMVLRLFRALLRQAKQLDNQPSLLLPLPPEAQWGTHRFLQAEEVPKTQVLFDLLPSLEARLSFSSSSSSPTASSTSTSTSSSADRESPLSRADAELVGRLGAGRGAGSGGAAAAGDTSLRRLVSSAFRTQRHAQAQHQQGLIDEAFKALRLALEQQYLSRCSSSCTTEGVRVDVTSRFDQVALGVGDEKVHVFTYRVRVSNERQEPIKVLGRSWTIRNDHGQVRVHIPLDPDNAVVGQQPMLSPGHCFEYFSGTDMDTPAGLQSGSLLVDVFGNGRGRPATERVIVNIAPFPLLHPSALK